MFSGSRYSVINNQQVVVEAIKEFAKEAGKPRWDWVAPEPNTDLINKVKAIAEARLGDAYRITEKQARYEQIDAIKADVMHKSQLKMKKSAKVKS